MLLRKKDRPSPLWKITPAKKEELIKGQRTQVRLHIKRKGWWRDTGKKKLQSRSRPLFSRNICCGDKSHCRQGDSERRGSWVTEQQLFIHSHIWRQERSSLCQQSRECQWRDGETDKKREKKVGMFKTGIFKNELISWPEQLANELALTKSCRIRLASKGAFTYDMFLSH